MKACLIVIGDELLIGKVADTNSSVIARALTEHGWDVVNFATVGDSRESISAAVRRALDMADLVVTTGGLGPTRDDITKSVLMDIFGGELRHNPLVEENVREVFKRRGLKINELTLQQAYVPDSCTVINNTFGTAPLMCFEQDGKMLVCMPGVPFETRGMLPAVVQHIDNRFGVHGNVSRAEFTVTGITESALAERLAGYEDKLPEHMHLAYLPNRGRIVLRLEGAEIDSGCFKAWRNLLKEELGQYLAGEGALTSPELVLGRLRAMGLTLGSAESCTGGNIAHCITLIAGCSDVFKGSVVSYSNEVKHNVLGVSASDLDTYGAVSEPVVRQMAEGACRCLGVDCAVATSGIAGPAGATDQKPVGTVWMAVHTPRGTVSEEQHIDGDRQAVIDGATEKVLLLLLKQLESNKI